MVDRVPRPLHTLDAPKAAPLLEIDILVRLGRDHFTSPVDQTKISLAVRQAVEAVPGVRKADVCWTEAASVNTPDWISLSRVVEPINEEAARRCLVEARAAALLTIATEQIGDISGAASAAERGGEGGFADAQGYRLPSSLSASDPQQGIISQFQSGERGASSDNPSAAPKDHVLLCKLLELANPYTDPSEIADGAIRRFGSFAAVLAAPLRDLRAVPGFGIHSIAAIKLMHEAALRLAKAGVMNRPVLDNWPRLIDYLAAQLGREKIEQFRVLFLDERDRLLADEAQARGTVNHTPVYPREVVRRALELQAASVILVHNHPSGDPTPSRDDLAMTAQVGEAAEVLSIVLKDHVIVGNGRWVSFRQEGLL